MNTNKRAISLIVLIITVIILGILATAVIMSLNNTNIINKAKDVVFKSDISNYREIYELYVTNKTLRDFDFDRSGLNVTHKNNPKKFEEIFGDSVPGDYIDGIKIVAGEFVYDTDDEKEKDLLDEMGIASSVTPSDPSEPSNPSEPSTEVTISKDTSFVGYYADVDGNGTVDGIIFADLAVSSSGTWSQRSTEYNSSYSYTAVSDKTTLKDYVVSKASYTATSSDNTALKYGTHPVLKLASSTTGTEDRFYVMALSDVTNSSTTSDDFTWYSAAYTYKENESSSNTGINNASSQVTSTDFKKGKTNTATMITKWNSAAYGTKNAAQSNDYLDLWGSITTGWFVPSKDEWTAFACYMINNNATDAASSTGLKFFCERLRPK